MSPSEGMKIHSKQLLEKASQSRQLAYEKLLKLNDGSGILTLDMLERLAAIFGKVTPEEDIDVAVRVLDEFLDARLKFLQHLYRKSKSGASSKALDPMIERFYEWDRMMEILGELIGALKTATSFRNASAAASDLSDHLKSQGQ